MNILLYARCHECDLMWGIIHRCLKGFFLWVGGGVGRRIVEDTGKRLSKASWAVNQQGRKETQSYDGAFSGFYIRNGHVVVKQHV